MLKVDSVLLLMEKKSRTQHQQYYNDKVHCKKKKKKKVAEADCLKLLSLPNFFFFLQCSLY